MSDSISIAGHSPEALHPTNIGASAAKQYERARRLVSITRSVGPVNTAKFLYGRFTGTDIKDEIKMRTGKLRFPLTITATPSDVYNYAEVLDEEVYRLPRSLGDRINGRPIVDAGAYIGISAAYFASSYPDSSILAIEPHARNYRMLAANVDAYGDQIDPRLAAFVAEPGGVDRTILESPQSHMTHLYSSGGPDGSDTGSGPVAMTPELLLEAMDGEEIGLLKIDIEGAERDVFHAPAMAEVLAATNLLMVETHDRFVPGSSMAVETATAASGMESLELNPHTSVYLRA